LVGKIVSETTYMSSLTLNTTVTYRTIHNLKKNNTVSRYVFMYIQGGPKNGASVFHCKYFENSKTEL